MNHTDIQPSLYLALVLSLTPLPLILFAYTAPTLLLHSKVALLVVSPSLELTNSSSSQGTDGLTVFLGALGSCSRPNEKGSVTCTPPTVSPTYGLTAFLVIRMWFGKAVEDFNKAITQSGSGAPHLIAQTGNDFTMVWVGYAFYAVPLNYALARLHVMTGSK
ncbi:hypothetical protein EDB83DRAFT_2503214 [Lactarius deliciosus]|nr:hypothetical protein EDB83DRAFT_2503214 [Lactarius deliciosus]